MDNNGDNNLKDKLFRQKNSGWLQLDDKERQAIENFSKQYMAFLGKAKTERLCIRLIRQTLEKNGFQSIEKVKALASGDRVYKVWKDKSLLACVVGNDPEEFRLVGSHADSPRLDLKPTPLYERANLALLQSHYYGGIKKYQWMNLRLALHGVVYLKSGERVELSLGEKAGEPQFLIPDLLIHLSREQMEKKGNKIVEGEDLNIIVGSIPLKNGKAKDQIKLNVLNSLNTEYGLHEEDLNFAELEFVPAGEPVEIGFDRSLIAGYSHDDRSCVFTSLQALLAQSKPKKTAVAMFTDKEEIGSYGNTGAHSHLLRNFSEDYVRLSASGIPAYKLLEQSRSISADVSPAKNPNFEEVFDGDNISYLGFGVTLDKYNGSRGKYGTNDTHAEYMHQIRNILESNGIPWQIGELGKIDKGGGGTIAVYLSQYGMDCIDAGPCVLGMHSPNEVISKLDLHAAFRLYDGFFRS